MSDRKVRVPASVVPKMSTYWDARVTNIKARTVNVSEVLRSDKPSISRKILDNAGHWDVDEAGLAAMLAAEPQYLDAIMRAKAHLEDVPGGPGTLPQRVLRCIVLAYAEPTGGGSDVWWQGYVNGLRELASEPSGL